MERNEFQSTCLREARLAFGIMLRTPHYFNPRAYVRHDSNVPASLRPCTFQSTCLREARLPGGVAPAGARGFQSTCLREARPDAVVRVGRGVISIHVPT